MTAAKQVQIIQGTPAWHEWRRKGIGASDVAAIFGKSPYKTKRDLWFEKVGLGEPEDEDRSYIYRKGHQAEAELRELFSKHTKIEIKPACFEKEIIFLGSLDGYEKTIGILEAKLVGKEALNLARSEGTVPEHHFIQVQAQLHASDSDKAFWGGKAPNVKGGIVVEIGRDEKMIALIRDEVRWFWDLVEKNEAPPLTDQDTVFITDPEKIALFEKLCLLKAEKDRLEEAYSEIEAKVKAMATHPKVKCHDVSITETERQGAVDYSKIPEIKALALEYIESFRKKSSVFKTIRFKREA
jgi:putative phage-type endonuclease